MAGLDELRVTFFQECEDLLDRLGSGLRDLAAGGGGGAEQDELVHSVFRAVHSIKGGAGAFGLDDLVGFSHLFETVLDTLRSGRAGPTPQLLDTLLRAGDMLDDLVRAARDGGAPPQERLARIVAELDLLAEGAGEDTLEDFVFEPLALDLGGTDAVGPGDGAGAAGFDILLAPRGEMYMNGNEPAALIAALATLGPLTVTAGTGRIRPLAAFDGADPGLRWQLRLQTGATAGEVAALFDFVEDLAEITIEPLPGTPPGPDPGGLPAAAAGESEPPASAPVVPPGPATDPPAAVPAPAMPAPATPAGGGTVVPMAAPATVRVNLDRVDRLINLIGELVIMEAVLSRIIADAGLESNSDAVSGLDRIRQLADEIQESVMAIRAQPLRPVFQRMERILREATEATGKRARLVTRGAETEVDRTVIERLTDPLTHMIRNAVDHGLEDAAARAATGKPAEGTITLSAAHRSGRVLIEIADDGGGIDRARVRRLAEDRGLVTPAAVLTPAETDAILFRPGFSSREEVSAVSGRGVGLDVVQREIQALGGRVTIASEEGAGTRFTIALPLTLAVLDGMLVEFGGQTMVLPLAAVAETLSPAGATLHATGATGQMLANRGRLIPVVDLAARFGLPSPGPGHGPGVFIIIESESGTRVALAAGAILDQRQVVIKSLEENYGTVPGVSAATILGDGRIALILDPDDILRGAGAAAAGAPRMAGGMA